MWLAPSSPLCSLLEMTRQVQCLGLWQPSREHEGKARTLGCPGPILSLYRPALSTVTSTCVSTRKPCLFAAGILGKPFLHPGVVLTHPLPHATLRRVPGTRLLLSGHLCVLTLEGRTQKARWLQD